MSDDQAVKVVALQPGRIIKGHADPDIIEMLERYLDEARRGEISGIAIAVARPNDMTGTAFWYGESAHRLTAAVAMLNHNVLSYAAGTQTEGADVG